MRSFPASPGPECQSEYTWPKKRDRLDKYLVFNMAQVNSDTNLECEAEKLLESAILANLEMTPEGRIEAHEHARELMLDLQAAGRERGSGK